MPAAKDLIDKYLNKPKEIAKNIVDAINAMNPDGIAKLYQRSEERGSTFDIKYDFSGKDKFVDQKLYQAGNAFIHMSKEFYDLIDKEADKYGCEVNWNNDKSVGWIYYKRESK